MAKRKQPALRPAGKLPVEIAAGAAVLGVDTSIAKTGYHLIGPGGDVVRSGRLETPPEKFPGEMERLKCIRTSVCALAEQFSPTLVVFEDFAHNAAQGAHVIGGSGYLIRYKLWQRGIPFITVAPMSLKKYVKPGNLAKGEKVDKNIVVREVFRRWRVEAHTEDEADAAVLAHIGRALIGAEEPTTKAQQEVLRTLPEVTVRERLASDSNLFAHAQL